MVPKLTALGYRVFATWDEPNTVAAVELGPGVTHATVAEPPRHFSLYAGIEKPYGLLPLRNATQALAISI